MTAPTIAALRARLDAGRASHEALVAQALDIAASPAAQHVFTQRYADAALAAEIVHPDRAQALADYLVEVRKASDIDRLATDRPKTGVDLGITAKRAKELIGGAAEGYRLREAGQ